MRSRLDIKHQSGFLVHVQAYIPNVYDEHNI